MRRLVLALALLVSSPALATLTLAPQSARLTDATGTNVVSLTSNSLNVNCTGGCSAPADTVTSGATLSVACTDGNIQSCAANSTVEVVLTGDQGCGFSINSASSTLVGIASGDFSMELTGPNWVKSTLVDYTGNSTSTLGIATGTSYSYSVAVLGGARRCRVRTPTVTSGSATGVVINATNASAIGNAIQGTGVAGTAATGVLTVQGITGGTALITDDLASSPTGSTVPAQAQFIAGGAAGGAGNLTGATVKTASTAAVATDTALVVQLAPNQPNLTTALNVTQALTTPTSCVISTACAGGTACAATSFCSVALGSDSSTGAAVTAISAPTGITMVVDVSINNGTTWSEVAAGNGFFDNAKTLVKSTTITTYAVGDTYNLIPSGGASNIRVRASALTSGTVTFAVGASDVQDPSSLFSSPGGATSAPPGFAVVAAQDGVTTTTINPIRSQAPNTAAGTVPGLVVFPAKAGTLGTTNAITTANTGQISVDVNGVTYINGKLATNTAVTNVNPVLIGAETQSAALPTASTAGNQRTLLANIDGALYTQLGSPLLFNSATSTVAAALTQVVAAPAAATSLYLTDIMVVSDTATAGQYTLRYGTGTNCGTGTTTIYPNLASITTGKIPYPGNTANSPFSTTLTTPIKVPAANALCVICVATNTCTINLSGFTAP
jgi:hypothetical protein